MIIFFRILFSHPNLSFSKFFAIYRAVKLIRCFKRRYRLAVADPTNKNKIPSYWNIDDRTQEALLRSQKILLQKGFYINNKIMGLPVFLTREEFVLRMRSQNLQEKLIQIFNIKHPELSFTG